MRPASANHQERYEPQVPLCWRLTRHQHMATLRSTLPSPRSDDWFDTGRCLAQRNANSVNVTRDHWPKTARQNATTRVGGRSAGYKGPGHCLTGFGTVLATSRKRSRRPSKPTGALLRTATTHSDALRQHALEYMGDWLALGDGDIGLAQCCANRRVTNVRVEWLRTFSQRYASGCPKRQHLLAGRVLG